nr:hypothetical protein [Hymenobacter fodinae]
MKVDFEVVGSKIAELRMPPFGVVVGDVVADFEFGFGQVGKPAAVEEFGLEAALTGFGVGIVVAVAPPAHALPRPAAGEQLLKAGGHVLVPWSECTMSPARGWRTAKARRRASLTRSSGLALGDVAVSAYRVG